MASTVSEFTYDLQDVLGGSAKVRVELRTESGRYWARATPANLEGVAGSFEIGTVKLQLRQRVQSGGVWLGWESWVTKKSNAVLVSEGQEWTDDTYNPPNSTSTVQQQVRAAFTSSYPEGGDPSTQGTPGTTT